MAKAIPKSFASEGELPGNNRMQTLLPVNSVANTTSSVACSGPKNVEYPAFPDFGLSTIEVGVESKTQSGTDLSRSIETNIVPLVGF